MSDQMQEPAPVGRAGRIEHRGIQEGLRRVRSVLCEEARLRIVEALDEDEMSVGDLSS